MRRGLLLPTLLAAAVLTTTARAADPAHVVVPPLRTSIYVGSVILTPSVFERHGEAYTATYEAKVRPWFWWAESGTVTIRLTDADLARVLRGETVEFAGSGHNQKGKPRQVSGRVQPADARTGKLKIRIRVDGIELVFNGTYAFGER